MITLTGVDWSRGGMTTFLADGVEETGFAGVIQANYDGTPLELFCVDLFTGISFGDYASNTVFPRAVRHEDRAAWLYLSVFPGVTTAEQGEALQLAIWDIVHDGGDGFGAGRVQASVNSNSSVILFADSYLIASLGQSSFDASIFRNAALQTGQPAQTLIGALQPGTIANPEPGTFVLFAGAFVTLFFKQLFRRPNLRLR